MLRKIIPLLIVGLMFSQNVGAQSLSAFERNVTEHTLENGLKIIVVKRDIAPVASFMTYVNVGGINEPIGLSGIAHVFEHMAFKGSTRIGTNNWEKEAPLLDEIDETYTKWLRESRSPRPNQARVDSLKTRFRELEEEAKQYVVNNEFSQIVEREGAQGLNAGTGPDQTFYFYSLPQNKAELWFSMEAERFKDPVLREFYVEKDVIMEERRMRTDSNPVGRLVEEFLAVAFTALPYRDALIGWPSDIEAATIADALRFYEQFYVPSNMFIVIVGDVDPKKMIEFAELYFGDIPAGNPPPGMYVREPRQRGERRFEIVEQSQPFLIMGYKGVEGHHKDALAISLMTDILASGRTSRLNERLVEEEKLALGFQVIPQYPSNKFQSLIMLLGIPNQGVDLDDLEAGVEEELERLKNELVSAEELQSVITRRRASVLRQLGNNFGISLLLAQTEGSSGNWREVFFQLDEMQKITPEDIQRVAKTYFDKTQRTVGRIVNEPQETASSN